MNVQEYKQQGYNLSVQIDQTVIDRAEKDVMDAYLGPIMQGKEIDQQIVSAAVMVLAFMLILQRSIAGTRAGAKEKTSAQSVQADRWQIVEQCAGTCQLRLAEVAQAAGCEKPWRVVHDLCGVYYNKRFLGL